MVVAHWVGQVWEGRVAAEGLGWVEKVMAAAGWAWVEVAPAAP